MNSTEAIAVLKTLKFIKKQKINFTNNVILTYSLSTFKSLENTINPTDISKCIQGETIKLKHRDINIIFIWIPGHTNIEGNEMVDKSAKEAALPDNQIQFLDILTYSEIKTHIKNSTKIKWQLRWSKQQTKLCEIKNNTIQNWQRKHCNLY